MGLTRSVGLVSLKFSYVKCFAVLCYLFLLIAQYWKTWSEGTCHFREIKNKSLIEKQMIFQVYSFPRLRVGVSNFKFIFPAELLIVCYSNLHMLLLVAFQFTCKMLFRYIFSCLREPRGEGIISNIVWGGRNVAFSIFIVLHIGRSKPSM